LVYLCECQMMGGRMVYAAVVVELVHVYGGL